MLRILMVLIALLLSSGLAFAQPQAPVVWEDSRALDVYNSPRPKTQVAYGDTIIAAVFQRDPLNEDHSRPAVTYSHDNGQTFSAPVPLQQRYTLDWVNLYGDHSRVCIFVDTISTYGYRSYIRCSTDDGVTWNESVLVESPGYAGSGFVDGEQIIRIRGLIRPDTQRTWRASVSQDGGAQWQHEVLVQDGGRTMINQGAIVATRDHLLIVGYRFERFYPDECLSLQGSRDGLVWNTFQPMFTEPLAYSTGAVKITSDPTCETAVVLMTPMASDWSPQDLWVTRTTDGGATWAEAVDLAEGEPGSGTLNPEIFSRGKLVGFSFPDDTNPDTTRRGIYFRFSANHGKSWYPQQWIHTSLYEVQGTTGQFFENEVRLYWRYFLDWHTSNVRMISGTVTTDTLSPVLESAQFLDTLYVGGETIHPSLIGWDDDSLWQAALVLKREGSADSVLIPLMRSQVQLSRYEGQWQIPADTADWSYYYLVEDMWEQVAVFPAEPGHFHVRPLAVEDHTPLPSAYTVTVFPNPSNGWPSLTLSPDWFGKGPATITLYNLLGQTVGQAVLTRSSGRIALGIITSSEHGSGIFLLSVSNGERHATEKILILK